MSQSLSDPGACARCAAHFSTCCVIRPHDRECCFPLAPAERAAIIAHTGSQAGIEREVNSAAFINAMRDLFPEDRQVVLARFPLGEAHDRLAVLPNGACFFLHKDGCALPRAARPAYCRIFPFWVRRGEIWHFAMRDCQAQREHRGHAALRQSFQLSEHDIHTLYGIVRAGWGLPPRAPGTK